MIEHFDTLTEEEFEKLKDAVPLIAVLIAGADGTFDKKELDWANKVTTIRSYSMKAEMKAFYQEVGKNFSDKLENYIDSFPVSLADRNKLISERLEYINPILAKLEPAVAYKCYKSFLSFAEHVAKASGGIFGFFSINHQEAKWVKLPMLHPIAHSNDQEEE